MKNYTIKLVGSHQELKNHVPKSAVFLSHPQINNAVLLGQLYYRITDVVHYGDDDQNLPLLFVKFIDDQSYFEKV